MFSIITAWVEAAQGMEVLGFLCLLAALVTVIVKLFVVKDKPVLKWVVVGCLVVGGKKADITDYLFYRLYNKAF